MNPRILENIVLRADIDTRRTLGIYRKLPKTDFTIPYSVSNSNSHFTYVIFSHHTLILTSHYACWSRVQEPVIWKFFFRGKECCVPNEHGGREFFVHPDFHTDGSFKRSFPFTSNITIKGYNKWYKKNES